MKASNPYRQETNPTEGEESQGADQLEQRLMQHEITGENTDALG